MQAQAAVLRTTVWPAVLAALLVVGLLVAFYQVVQGAVDQAMLRRQTAALHAEADRRCRPAPDLVRRAGLPDAAPAARYRAGCQPPQ